GTGNRLTTDGVFTYTYDAVGNLTQKSKGAGLETWYYGWDGGNHLTSVRKTSNGSTNTLTATYTYDAMGDQVQEDKCQTGGSGVSARFGGDGVQVVMDMNGSNVVQERYVRGDQVNQLLAQIDANGNAAWILTDRLGSVRDVTDASGTSVDHVDYAAYGA